MNRAAMSGVVEISRVARTARGFEPAVSFGGGGDGAGEFAGPHLFDGLDGGGPGSAADVEEEFAFVGVEADAAGFVAAVVVGRGRGRIRSCLRRIRRGPGSGRRRSVRHVLEEPPGGMFGLRFSGSRCSDDDRDVVHGSVAGEPMVPRDASRRRSI